MWTLHYTTLHYVLSVFIGFKLLTFLLQRKIKIVLLSSQINGRVLDSFMRPLSHFLFLCNLSLFIARYIPSIIIRRIV
nr:MAG TPA: hypothetical protein [Caudoviricetes sp.]